MRVLSVALFVTAAAEEVTMSEPKDLMLYNSCREMEDGFERCESERPEFFKICKKAEDGAEVCSMCVETEQGQNCDTLEQIADFRNEVVANDVAVIANVNLNIPYFYQYNNARFPGSSCQNTVIAMALKWKGWSGTPDLITSRWGKDYAQSPSGFSDLLTTEGKNYGIRISSRARTSASLSDMKRYLDQGKPVPIHGYFTGYGHVVMVVGYNSGGYYVNDPAGRWTQRFKGGYGGSSGSSVGKGIYYGKAAFEAAVATSNGSTRIPLWIHELSTW